MARSRLAPERFPDMPNIEGIDLSVTQSNIKYKNRFDLMLIKLCDNAQVAGVFTRSDTAAAPVDWSRKNISSGSTKAIFTNAGNANAFTGAKGHDTVHKITTALGKALGVFPNQIL